MQHTIKIHHFVQYTKHSQFDNIIYGKERRQFNYNKKTLVAIIICFKQRYQYAHDKNYNYIPETKSGYFPMRQQQ